MSLPSFLSSYLTSLPSSFTPQIGNAVLDSLSGYEFYASMSVHSHLVDRAMSLATHVHVRGFLLAVADRIKLLARHGMGGKIVEKGLRRLGGEKGEEEEGNEEGEGREEEDMNVMQEEEEKTFAMVVNGCKGGWVEMMKHKVATFTVRQMIKMCEIKMFGDVMIDLFANEVMEVMETDREGMITDPACSICLQNFLVMLHKISSPKVDAICGSFLALKETGKAKNADSKDIVYALLTHRIGSRLVESVIKYASDNFVFQLLKKHFIGSFAILSQHSSANFIVSTVFERICSFADQDHARVVLLAALNELIPQISNLLRNRGAVIWRLTEACFVLQVKTSEIFQSIRACVDTQQGENILQKFLKLNVTPGSEDPVSATGCSLLLVLLKISADDCQDIINFIFDMSPDQILVLACNKTSCRLIEIVITVFKWRKKLLKLLRHHFADIACDKFGSFVIEKLFSLLDFEMKGQVMDELSKSMHRLTGNFFGRRIASQMKVCPLVFMGVM